MNIWVAVAVLVGVVLIPIVVIEVRRPRHAEDELEQPKRQAVHVEPIGPLGQPQLGDFLRFVQRERETGTLQVTAGGRTGTLYFLFGHLFHAVCGTQTGEAAVRECLGWHDVHYTLDTKSPLPTEETIERPLDEILA